MTIRPFEFEIHGEVRQGGSKFNMKKLKKKTFDIKGVFFSTLPGGETEQGKLCHTSSYPGRCAQSARKGRWQLTLASEPSVKDSTGLNPPAPH